MEPAIRIFTDGACKANQGSWAYVIVKQEQLISQGSGLVTGKSDSCRAELYAIIHSLRATQKLGETPKLELITDRIDIVGMLPHLNERLAEQNRLAHRGVWTMLAKELESIRVKFIFLGHQDSYYWHKHVHVLANRLLHNAVKRQRAKSRV